jgi:hypothetical protein
VEQEAERQRAEQAQKDEEHERLVALDKKNRQIVDEAVARILEEREAKRQLDQELLRQYSRKK